MCYVYAMYYYIHKYPMLHIRNISDSNCDANLTFDKPKIK